MLTATEYLARDHEEHEQLLCNLVRAMARDISPEEVRAAWLPFEHSLLEHLDAEERSLFCVFTQAHRSEIDALRSEHRRIRYAVIELSVSMELHSVKKAALDDLLALIRAHTVHEHRTLHKWLDEDEGISSRRAVLAMLARRTERTRALSADD
jgi:hypothetical protein